MLCFNPLVALETYSRKAGRKSTVVVELASFSGLLGVQYITLTCTAATDFDVHDTAFFNVFYSSSDSSQSCLTNQVKVFVKTISAEVLPSVT